MLLLAVVILGSAWASTTTVEAQSGGVFRDITYCLESGQPLKLDLYQPTNGAGGPHPIVLWIHGGTWMFGDKSDARSDPVVDMLRARGIAVAAINYALAPTYRFPAQIQDLTCGVRFLRAHASKYGIDRAHIGALGMSAGGHLSGMLGVDDGSSMFVGGGYANWSSAVQAVADLWGVNDLTQHNLAPGDERVLPQIFGPQRRWASESPITYVRAGLPPFLLIHGDHDTDVPIRQSRSMYKALAAAGDPATFTVVHNAGHSLAPTGGTMSPSIGTVRKEIVSWFKAQLGG